jgi:cytochrome b561
MRLKGDAQNWSSLAKFFHWTIVLLILVQGVLGLYMVELPKKPAIIPYYNFHKSVGMLVLALAVARLAWRAFDPRPAEPPSTPHWQSLGARAGHALLYVLLFAVPLSGWWFDSVTALRPMLFFGLFEIPHIAAPDPELKQLAHEAHEWGFWLLVFVACGHAAMALVHQFVNRDGTLSRMLPGRGRALATAPITATSFEPAPILPENDHVENPPAAAPPPAEPAARDPGA